VYKPDEPVSEYNFTETLSGENVLPGFTIALSKLK